MRGSWEPSVATRGWTADSRQSSDTSAWSAPKGPKVDLQNDSHPKFQENTSCIHDLARRRYGPASKAQVRRRSRLQRPSQVRFDADAFDFSQFGLQSRQRHEVEAIPASTKMFEITRHGAINDVVPRQQAGKLSSLARAYLRRCQHYGLRPKKRVVDKLNNHSGGLTWDFSGIPLGDDGSMPLLDVLSLTRVAVLRLSETKVGNGTARFLAMRFRSHFGLQKVDLSGNPAIGTVGARALCALIEACEGVSIEVRDTRVPARSRMLLANGQDASQNVVPGTSFSGRKQISEYIPFWQFGEEPEDALDVHIGESEGVAETSRHRQSRAAGGHTIGMADGSRQARTRWRRQDPQAQTRPGRDALWVMRTRIPNTARYSSSSSCAGSTCDG